MSAADVLQTRLEALLGAQRVWMDAPHTAPYALASMTPTVVVQPETVSQVVAVLAFATRERLAVVPWGQGTQMHLGQVPQRYDLALSLASVTRVVEYDSANLTLIAEAGMPLRDVYQLTAPQRQFLPLGYAGTAASLGGLLVTNTSGVKRLRYGGVRDLALGVRVALPEGSLVHFGGRVVKNVAGYDMTKLFIGSLGVFGVVVETTYRLAALPEDDRMLIAIFPTLTQAAAAVTALRASPLLPSALLLLSADVASTWETSLPWPVHSPQVVLLLNCDGMRDTVERQMRQSQALCDRHGAMTATLLTGTALQTVWERQEAWGMASDARHEPLLQLRLGVLPGALADLLTHLATPPAFCPQGLHWLADAGHGQLRVRLPIEQPFSVALGQTIHAWLQALRSHLRPQHGYCVVEQAPAALCPHLDVWGETPGAQLLQRYKQQFDPHTVLNPGRYLAQL